MIYTITLNPSIDEHITIKKLIKDDKIKALKIGRDPGGKGVNVSRVVQELGGQTKAFGFIGGTTGKLLEELLIRDHIPHAFCKVKGETRINIHLTDLSDQSQTRINAPGPKLDKACMDHFFHMIERIHPRPIYWALSGSLPLGVSPDIYKKMIHYLQKRNEPCVLDADDEPLKSGIEARPFFIKPNEFELQRLTRKTCTSDKEFLKAGKLLAKKVKIVAISLGAKGAIVVTKNTAWRLKAPRVSVQSKVGAGDSFVGGFLTALDKKKNFEEALRWAIACGSASVMSEGTKLCKKKDVLRLLKSVEIKKIF